MTWKLIVVILPVVLVVLGVQELYTALKNPSPVMATCGDYLAKAPEGHWLRLEKCDADWEEAAFEEETGSKDAKTLFVPLRAAGESSGETRLVLRTQNKAMLAKVNAGEYPEALDAYEGLVQFGTNLKDKERTEVAGLIGGLAKDFVLLEHGAKPKLGMALLCLGLGLGLAGFIVWRFVRSRQS